MSYYYINALSVYCTRVWKQFFLLVVVTSLTKQRILWELVEKLTVTRRPMSLGNKLLWLKKILSSTLVTFTVCVGTYNPWQMWRSLTQSKLADYHLKLHWTILLFQESQSGLAASRDPLTNNYFLCHGNWTLPVNPEHLYKRCQFPTAFNTCIHPSV